MDKNLRNAESKTMSTLPGDDARQIMWRFADRFDLQMMIQSARSAARGTVAQMVSQGERNTHDWTEAKQNMLKVFDDTGVTATFMEPHQGGYIEGPKNLATSLLAFELAWVDAGAATASLAGNLALAPIHERGTQEQVNHYMTMSCPAKDGSDRKVLRGAFALTEPIPNVGVETGMLAGRISVAKWEEGKEPILLVEKRGRFITNIGYADFVTAAVDTADERIASSCMVTLEKEDPGSWDPGAATLKLVHQLSSTGDPVLAVKVPASRIIGGYSIIDGKITPKYTHGDVIEAVFRRTRITVALMTAAKLISAVEPVIRYHRGRFQGAASVKPGTPRYEKGIQMKEDALQRLADVWATGEAASSLGFEAARMMDVLDPIEKAKDQMFEKDGISGPRAQMRAFATVKDKAMEFIQLNAKAETRQGARYEELKQDTLTMFSVLDAMANVIVPACKLWNTGVGATMLREAVSLMGGYGITEDCPGFLMQKWSDAQLEATYEGPEAVQRRQMSATQTHPLFLAQFEAMISEIDTVHAQYPQIGAKTTATGMKIWKQTLDYLQESKDSTGAKLYSGSRQGVTFPMSDALSWLLASYYQIMDTVELLTNGTLNPALAEGLEGLGNSMSDLCQSQAARCAGEAVRFCTELIYGYGSESNEKSKAVEALKVELNKTLADARLARDRVGKALAEVMIPQALDYPA